MLAHLECRTINGGRKARKQFNGSREMALVEKAGCDCYVADWSVRSGELTTSELDAELTNVLPDCQVVSLGSCEWAVDVQFGSFK